MAKRDLWHMGFARLVKQRAPPSTEVRPEVQLSDEPQRADLLLLRRTEMPPRDEDAKVLRALWAHLGADTILEFKSPVKGFRRADSMRLASYGAQYHALEHERLRDPRALTLVLVVPSWNEALSDEVARMGWTSTSLGGGYGRIDGGVYTVFTAITDEVAETERDDFLRIFSHQDCETRQALWWWEQWTAEDGQMQDIESIEGYEELAKKVVSRMSPGVRLAGLPPEQVLLALPDEMLRGFSEEALAALSPDVQAAIRRRIGRPAE